MYYIYHIKGKKIGCTNNLQERVEKQQGCYNYDILFTTDNIEKASAVELNLQIKYGYKQDKNSYKQTIMEINNKSYITQKTITFTSTKDQNLTDFEFPSYINYENQKIYFTPDVQDWIKKNNYKSQYSDERYIYGDSLKNYFNSLDNKEKPNIFDSIRFWAQDKGILDKGDSKTQYIKLQEEAGELANALLKNNNIEVIDAIGDIVVVLTNLAALEGLKIEDCIDAAYKVISKRTGKMNNGTFIKDK